MSVALFADILIAIGAFFIVSGAIGLVRLPDFFTRLHAAGVTDSAGAPLIVFGLMLKAGWTLVSLKLFLLLLFLLLTTPTATHALAKAALFCGLKPLIHPKDRTR